MVALSISLQSSDRVDSDRYCLIFMFVWRDWLLELLTWPFLLMSLLDDKLIPRLPWTFFIDYDLNVFLDLINIYPSWSMDKVTTLKTV